MTESSRVYRGDLAKPDDTGVLRMKAAAVVAENPVRGFRRGIIGRSTTDTNPAGCGSWQYRSHDTNLGPGGYEPGTNFPIQTSQLQGNLAESA